MIYRRMAASVHDKASQKDPAASSQPPSPLVWSCRLNLTLGVSMGLFLHYFIRNNLSVAIVCMVKPQMDVTGENDTGSVNSSRPIVARGASTCDPEDATVNAVHNFGYTGEFEWSRRQVGYILASYFYSYVLVQLLAGWLASRVGGKHVFGTGMLVAAVCMFLFPVCARTHVALVFLNRVLLGIGTGVTFPTMQAIMGLWIPPTERARLLGLCYTCVLLGSVVANIVMGQLCTVAYDNGWPLVFYLAGGLTVLWYLWWLRFVYSSPESHPRISEREKTYIQETLGRRNVSKIQAAPVPWRALLSSRPVWAIAVSHICMAYSLYTVLTVVPLYMQDVLQYSIKKNGLMSSLPTILNITFGLGNGLLADMLVTRHFLSITKARKLMNAIATIGPAVFYVALSFLRCEQRSLAVALLCIGVTIMSANRAAVAINHGDIAPRFAGIVYGFSNTLANTMGFVVPIVTAALTPNGTQAEWQRVFFTCAAFNVVSFIIYTCWASGKVQPWAQVDDHSENDNKDYTLSIVDKRVDATSKKTIP